MNYGFVVDNSRRGAHCWLLESAVDYGSSVELVQHLIAEVDGWSAAYTRLAGSLPSAAPVARAAGGDSGYARPRGGCGGR